MTKHLLLAELTDEREMKEKRATGLSHKALDNECFMLHSVTRAFAPSRLQMTKAGYFSDR